MAEKKNYRDMLEFLSARYPLLLTKTQVAEILDVCPYTLRQIIKENNWKITCNKIPIGTLANYLCG